MDEFVRSKLKEWGFDTDLIQRFQDEEVDKESFLCLEENEIDHLIKKAGPRAKFKKRLKELKSEVKNLVCEQETDLGQALPSTSNASDEQNTAKRKMEPEPEVDHPPKVQRHSMSRPGSFRDDLILSDVKRIMHCVHDRLSHHENSKLNAFLRKKIWDLCTDKRELVGVFGKTGAGKSSLINAIIGDKDLLPSGSLTACTTVMIKVETNTQSNKYEAEIEFISKEEWNDELWSVQNLFGDNTEEEKEEDDEEFKDNEEKMTALYGDDWKGKSPENLLESKYFKEIPEFLHSRRKIVTVESVKELSAKVLKYTRTGSDEGSSKDVKRWYWPLVKCVTVKIPNNDFLKHVTLVDLPGNGDRNKSRDQMWREVVASCSTVWIVSEMNRAAADRDAWEILESACSLMGNGGECQNIYFICTKSDSVNEDDSATFCQNVLKKNEYAKNLMRREFKKLSKVTKQFKDDCFEVFTVSSKEFLKPKQRQRLQPDDTEIPQLQERLKRLNDQHDQTLNYVSGAYGILSLIKGANCKNMELQQTTQVCATLNENIERELQTVKKSIENVHRVFEKCLNEGVKRSKDSCEENLKKKLYPKGKGRGFHRQLKCAMKNNGIHKTKKKEINLNLTLSAFLTDSIDEEFRKAFPNDGKSGPFYGAIHAFSLDTQKLIQLYNNYELQLTFLKTEEENVKAKLCKVIRHRKKIIYNSLVETVVEAMQDCYKKAAEIRGTGSLDNVRQMIERHVHDVKNTMFDQAKDGVLAHLKGLMELVQKELRETLQESIELSFKTNDKTIPDFATELSCVKKHLSELTGHDALPC